MATTTQATITQNWQKISDGDCVVQSKTSNELFEFAIGAEQPWSGASLLLRISEPVNLAFATPVWSRMPGSYQRTADQVITVVK